LLPTLAHPSAVIIAREVDDAYPDGIADHAIGTGPFILERMGYEDGADLVKNPLYWEGEPLIDGVNLLSSNDPTVAHAALIANDLDMTSDSASLHPGKRRFDELQSDRPNDFGYAFYPTGTWSHIKFNTARPPFDNPAVRRAFDLVIDREEINLLAFEGGFQPQGVFSPTAMAPWSLTLDQLAELPGYRADKEADIADAKALLEASGVGPLTLELTGDGTAGFLNVAISAADQWRRHLGADITVNTGTTQDNTARLNARDFTIHNAVHGQGVEPDEITRIYYRTGASRNYGDIADSALDGMIDRVATTIDNEARKEAVDELQYHMLEQSYFTFMGNPFIYRVQNAALRNHLQETWISIKWRWSNRWGLAAS
jgi:peptide/nickel transport system substrate-binding protein